MKHRVLLLDNHPAFRDSVAWFLRRERYEVHTVGDGDEAANLLRRSRFDLVITDHDHPGLSADRIAELSERCIVLTCSWHEPGAHKFVPIEALVELVKQRLASRDTSAPADRGWRYCWPRWRSDPSGHHRVPESWSQLRIMDISEEHGRSVTS